MSLSIMQKFGKTPAKRPEVNPFRGWKCDALILESTLPEEKVASKRQKRNF